MVFLVLTRAGFDEITSCTGGVPSPLWVNKGVLSPDELADLRAKGSDISSFSNHIAPTDTNGIVGVLGIIAEHHPGQRIWVEHYGDA
jgi:hypothetical protein